MNTINEQNQAMTIYATAAFSTFCFLNKETPEVLLENIVNNVGAVQMELLYISKNGTVTNKTDLTNALLEVLGDISTLKDVHMNEGDTWYRVWNTLTIYCEELKEQYCAIKPIKLKAY